MDKYLLIPLGLVGLALILITIMVIGVMNDENKWQKIKVEHHCKLSAHIQGSFDESHKTVYICDDGITYYREE